MGTKVATTGKTDLHHCIIQHATVNVKASKKNGITQKTSNEAVPNIALLN